MQYVKDMYHLQTIYTFNSAYYFNESDRKICRYRAILFCISYIFYKANIQNVIDHRMPFLIAPII